MNEKLRALIAEHLSVEVEKVAGSASFKEDLGADSLDLFSMVMALEEAFGIEIPAEDLEKLNNVDDVERYLKEKDIE